MTSKISTISGVNRTKERTLSDETLTGVDELEFEPQPTNATLDYATIAAAPQHTSRGYDEVVEILASPLDMSVTKQRVGFNGKTLNYLDGKYVIQTLNRLFGYGNWGYEATAITDMALDPDVLIPVAVSANVSLWVTFPGGKTATFADTGFGENVKPSYWDDTQKKRIYKDRTWSGYEMARKGAVTDALKRAAANLGDQFGLSLKGSDGDGVANNETTATATTSAPARSSEGSQSSGQTHYACEECGEELRGYTAKASGKVYTAADMAKFSIRDTGRVLCYDHKKEHLDNNR